ncbi:hypothetical protein NDU88_001169 [Pleurodeles waltl]|uniref:Uncharacterized protein n=1 Tax=Pleurodeles waltl TaxID=8319 RepID=A0AAV7US12_PLEWA|nr:hypothetical protein NDU88_001169 [Pleurodeles waltl]
MQTLPVRWRAGCSHGKYDGGTRYPTPKVLTEFPRNVIETLMPTITHRNSGSPFSLELLNIRTQADVTSYLKNIDGPRLINERFPTNFSGVGAAMI